MAEYALNKDEILPGLTKKLLEDTKDEVRKALLPYKGRAIDADTKASMARQVDGALHKMRRRVGEAPFPTWITLRAGDSYDKLEIGVNYEKVPSGWDPAKVRAALGIEP